MEQKTDYESGRKGAMVFGGAVYVGVVLAATTLFISFILTAFPSDAYFSRFVMGVAGLLIGASMLAFPVALHTWAVGGTHRNVAIGLYYGEMFIVALNSIVSFASLLAKYSGYEVPEWIGLYEPFTILSIVYTLGAWGTIFQLDPMAKSRHIEREAEQKFNQKVAAKRMEFLDSLEGEDAVMRAAQAQIDQRYGADKFSNEPRHFGSGKQPRTLVDTLFKKNEANVEQPKPGGPFRPD